MNILNNSLQKAIIILLCSASSPHLNAAELPKQTELPQEITNIIAQHAIKRFALQETDFDKAVTTIRELMPFNKTVFQQYEQLNIPLNAVSDKFSAPASFTAYAVGTPATKNWLKKYFENKGIVVIDDQEMRMAILDEIATGDKYQKGRTLKNESTLASKYLTQLATELGTPAILALYDTLQEKASEVKVLDEWEWFETNDPDNIAHSALKKLAILFTKIPLIRNFRSIGKSKPEYRNINKRREIYLNFENINKRVAAYLRNLSGKKITNENLKNDIRLAIEVVEHYGLGYAKSDSEIKLINKKIIE